MQHGRRLRDLGDAADFFPLNLQPLNIFDQLLFGCTFGGGAHDNTGIRGQNLFQNFLETSAL